MATCEDCSTSSDFVLQDSNGQPLDYKCPVKKVEDTEEEDLTTEESSSKLEYMIKTLVVSIIMIY